MPTFARKLTSLFSTRLRAQRTYRLQVERLAIGPNAVLLEQQNGLSLDGNIYCILRELLSDRRYDEYTVHFVASATMAEAFRKELASRGLDVHLLIRDTHEYVRALATCSILITDNTLPGYYVKRPGQKLVNTWHGIPLKTLGRSEAIDAIETGNVQRSQALADYLLMPNPLMEQRFIRDYMLQGLSSGTVIPLGYPRNEAFLHRQRRHDGHRRYAWLPTFRGVGSQRGHGTSDMPGFLDQLDALLDDEETLYLKLHLVEQEQLDLSRYKHIEPVPTYCELYEFLATCDALATDYSSVMFDVTLGGIKVVLFPYDKETYLAERGLYDSLDTLPFPQVQSTEELVRELRSPLAYDNDAFVKQSWPYPTDGATAALCERLFLDSGPLPGEHPTPQAEKPTCLIYSEMGCDLDKLRDELLKYSREFEVRLAFPSEKGRGRQEFLASLPDDVRYTPLSGGLLATLPEKPLVKAGKADAVYALDRQRTFGSATFDKVHIHDGSDPRWTGVMRHLQRETA